MSFIRTNSIQLQTVHDPILEQAGVQLDVLRLDQIHPQVSGNKLFKLSKNIEAARQLGCDRLLSFGGAYSNHIHALAWTGNELGLGTIGIIRGEKPANLSPTLIDAQNWNMELCFVSRTEYRQRADKDYLDSLLKRFPNAYLIPEGGGNRLGVEGCQEIVSCLKEKTNTSYDLICCAVGTGSTLAGIASTLEQGERAMGVAVLKAGASIDQAVNSYLSVMTDHPSGGQNWSINHDYHFGGYAKFDTKLAKFIDHFIKTQAIPIEPVYTGKLFYAIYDLVRQGCYPKGSRLLAIHTGGLQGLRGTQERMERMLTGKVVQ